MPNPKQVTCLKCGWVHYEVSRESAVCSVRRFNEWYDSQGPNTKVNYLPFKVQRLPHEERDYELGYSKIENYDRCDSCGGSYKDFKDGSEISDGHTISPIIRRED